MTQGSKTVTKVVDEVEIAASRWIVQLLDRAAHLERLVEAERDPATKSRLERDDKLCQPFPLSNYVRGQLTSAFGALEALRILLVTEDDESRTVACGPVGPYTLMRQALDSAALALWILQPAVRSDRVLRLLKAEKAEAKLERDCRREFNEPYEGGFERRMRLIQQVVDSLALPPTNGAGTPKVRSNDFKLPTTTIILGDLAEFRDGDSKSWLGTWQLCSGHAHGKRWASLATHDQEMIEGTRTETGAEFMLTANYGIMASLLDRAVALTAFAAYRFLELARPPRQRTPAKHLPTAIIRPPFSCGT